MVYPIAFDTDRRYKSRVQEELKFCHRISMMRATVYMRSGLGTHPRSATASKVLLRLVPCPRRIPL